MLQISSMSRCHTLNTHILPLLDNKVLDQRDGPDTVQKFTIEDSA
jgi:hypothetical protein